MKDMKLNREGWMIRFGAVAWLRRFLWPRRRAEVWAMTPDGKLIRM